MKDQKAEKEQLKQIRKALENYALSNALQHMTYLAAACQDAPLVDELNDLQRSYNGLLNFIRQGDAKGVQTTQDNKAYQEKLTRHAFNAWSKLTRSIMLTDEKLLYTKTFRELETQEWLTLWAATDEGDDRFALQDRIFNALWTAPLWSERKTAEWFEFICRQNALVQQHWVGAISLSLWQLWDAQKVLLLKMMADSEHPEVQMQAAAGYIIAASVHETLFPFFPETLLQTNDSTLKKNIRILQREFVLMVESELLAEKEANDKDLDIKVEDAENPERMKRFLKAQQKYNQIRTQHGLDLSFSKRGILLICPFLHELSHWWAPFDEARSEVHRACYTPDGKKNKTYQLIVEASHECDLQLYLSCHIMSGKNVRLVIKSDLPDELIEEVDRTPLPLHKRVAQNLYRIATECPVQQYLPHIFDRVLFAANAVLAPCFTTQQTLEHASYLALIDAKEDIRPTLHQIEREDGLSAPLAKLIAKEYLAKDGDFATALNYFRQADLLEEADAELLKAMALCCHHLGKKTEELSYLHRIEIIDPDSVACTTGLAQIYYQQGDYEKALSYLFKLCYEHPELTNSWAQVILAELHLGRTEQASKHLANLITERADEPCVQMVAGVYHILQGQWSDALNHFKLAGQEEFNARQYLLYEFGFTSSHISLLVDAVG